MKLIALAAALAMGGTAIAQETPQPSAPPADSTSPTQDLNQQTMPPTSPETTGTTGAGTATDPGMTAPSTSSTEPAADPRGGYMPSGSPFSTGAPPAPGQQVTVQASPDPSVAFPPPAPLKKYPVCKRGQFDDCMQRGRR